MKTCRVFLTLLSALLVADVAAAPADKEQAELEVTLQSVVKEYLTELEKEDLAAVRKTIHADSEHFVQPLAQQQQLFPFYDLRHKLVVFTFLGGDRDCAAVRVMLTTTMARMEEIARLIKREPYKSRLRDSLFVFRRSTDGWKLWQDEKRLNDELCDQLAHWASVLQSRAAELQGLRKQGAVIELNCCVITSIGAEVEVNHNLLGQLGNLGVDLSITFYAHEDRDEVA